MVTQSQCSHPHEHVILKFSDSPQHILSKLPENSAPLSKMASVSAIDAQVLFERASDFENDNLTFPPLKVHQLYIQAYNLFDAGQSSEAQKFLKQAVRLETAGHGASWRTYLVQHQGRARKWLENTRLMEMAKTLNSLPRSAIAENNSLNFFSQKTTDPPLSSR